MTTSRAEKFRASHPLGWFHTKGDDFGWFEIKRIGAPTLCVMAAPSDEEWEHVSVSLKNRCPTWDEMCFVKSLFWEPEDVVVQYHPAESKYVNNHNFCLHLWRWKGEMPSPPMDLIGIKDLGLL